MDSAFKRLLNALGIYFESVPDRLRRRRFIVWTFFIVATIVVSLGIPRNKIDMSLDSWFPKNDSVKIALDHFRAQFGGDELIYLVYKPKNGDLFSLESLKAVEGIREDLLNFRADLKEGETSALERVAKVDTIASASVLKIQDDSLVAGRFIGDDFPLNERDREKLRNKAARQNGFSRLYFSEDFQYGAIVIHTDLGAVPVGDETSAPDGELDSDEGFGDDENEISMETDESARTRETRFKPAEMMEYVELMEAVDKVIYKKEYADRLEYYPVGTPPVMAFFMEQIKELLPLSIAMLAIMVILLGFLFRSFSSVLWPNALVSLSCVWTVGLSGWAGAVVTNMVTLTALLILAVGVADSIHVISAYQFFRNKDRAHEDSLRLAFQKAALPCLLTSATTIIGMLGITLSSIKHIRTFGYMSALGVGLAFMFTVYLLPLMLDLRSPSPSAKRKGKTAFFNPSGWTQKMLDRVLPIVEKSPFLVIAIFTGIFGVCVYGAFLVKVDSNIAEATREGSQLRRNYKIADENMAGTQNMEIYIDAAAENAFQNPAVLKTIERLQRKIENKHGNLVIRTWSLADVVKESYRTLNEGREEYRVVPDDPDILAQTMFMFGNANPEDRRRLVSDNYDKSHITAQLRNAGSYRYTDFFNEVKLDIDAAFNPLKSAYPSLEASVTGGLALIMRLTDYIAWSQIKSLGFVILIISVLMVFLFGSRKAGMLSIIPNLIPSVMTFGLLGLCGVALDSDTIIMAPVIIGIAVDDTIHFLTHYRGEVLKDMNIRRSLENTLKEVGQAISFTTLILGCGFFILSFSSNSSLLKVGVFGSAAIFAALFCDLFLLPALILTFKPKFLTAKEKKALKNAL